MRAVTCICYRTILTITNPFGGPFGGERRENALDRVRLLAQNGLRVAVCVQACVRRQGVTQTSQLWYRQQVGQKLSSLASTFCREVLHPVVDAHSVSVHGWTVCVCSQAFAHSRLTADRMPSKTLPQQVL